MKGRLGRWMRRIMLVGLLLVMALVVLAFLASQVFFTPDRLVHQLERKRNCRAAISEVSVSL